MTAFGWNFEHTYADLPEIFYQSAHPTPVSQPKLLLWNAALAELLGLSRDLVHQPDAASYFAGNKTPQGAQPLAQAYAGHQFGNFTLLGDGRALLLGEQVTPQGQRFDIQYKGSGRTPFSRRGDGRAALGPMLREFIISEAMHGLGIPTTRSLAVVGTGEVVMRDRPLPGAVLTRVASSHIRVGTFEYAAARGDAADIASLTLYTLERHFPDFPEDVPPALSLLQRVVAKQAELIARWMDVGFIHGVMNTDNMALSGETIDYGPCAFMDQYHPQTVFSSIDEQGRYAYANQARIGLWNLERFAATLLPLLHEDEETAVEMAQDALEVFADTYNASWLARMYRKIGVLESREGDQKLVTELMGLMQKASCDYTNTFRALPSLLDELKYKPDAHASIEIQKLKTETEFSVWHKTWTARLQEQKAAPEAVVQRMNAANPNVIARNHQVESALRAAEASGDITPVKTLISALQRPFEDLPEHEQFRAPPQPHERVVATFCGT